MHSTPFLIPRNSVELGVTQRAVDTVKTPPLTRQQLPTELLAAAKAISGIESEILAFGEFPKEDFDTALQEARRRWALALKFDRALFLWFPGSPKSPRDIVKSYGVSSPQLAEDAWLEAIWLWPDVEDQELVAEKFWSMNENVESVQTRIRRLQRLVFLATKGRAKRMRRLRVALDDPELRTKAAVNLQHLTQNCGFAGRSEMHVTLRIKMSGAVGARAFARNLFA